MRSSAAALDPLVGLVGQGGVARAEVAGGDAERREAGHVGPAELGADRQAVVVDEAAQHRVVEARAGALGGVDHDDLVAVLEHRAPAAPRTSACGLGRGAVGGEAAVERDGGEVGHDVAGHAARHVHGLERLAELAAVDHRAALRERRRPRAAPRRGGGRRCGPSTGRAVWARSPRTRTSSRSVPWQPASSAPLVGSPRMATSPATRSGRSRTRWPRPLCSAATSSPA